MALNKFLIIGTMVDQPIKQETNSGEKVKIKVNVAETPTKNTFNNIISIFCYDQSAEYCLRNVTNDDLLYIEGYLKPVANWNNQIEIQPIAKYVKKVINKHYSTNVTSKRSGFRSPYEFRHLAHKID